MLNNLRTRFERQLVYVSSGDTASPKDCGLGIWGFTPLRGLTAPHSLSLADLHWQHPGVGEPLPALQHLRQGAGAAV